MLKRLVRPAHAAGLAAVMLVGAVGTARAAAVTTSPGMAPVGAAPGLPEGARVTGLEPASATLDVTVALQSADPAGLGHLATEVSTPGTAQFRRFLRPGQVQRRFGASPAAVAAVGSWQPSWYTLKMPAESVHADQIQAVLGRLANRDRVHSEATVQADVRQLLLSGGLGLDEHDLDVDLEAPVADHRRIDIEVGFTVIEVKKDL